MKRPTVHVTPASRHDASAIARICLLAFKTSPRLKVLAPQYVGLSDAALLRTGLPLETNKIKQQIIGTNFSMKATVQTSDDQGRPVEKIVGFATWVSPDGPRRRTLVEWFLSNVYYRIRNYLKPIPVPEGIPSYRELIIEQRQFIFGEGKKFEGQKHWELDLVYVDPAWQGQGIGSALLEWGFQKARESDALIYLESSPMGIPVYKAKGFKIVVSLPREMWHSCGYSGDDVGPSIENELVGYMFSGLLDV